MRSGSCLRGKNNVKWSQDEVFLKSTVKSEKVANCFISRASRMGPVCFGIGLQ